VQMKVLIVGGLGYIGYEVARHLQQTHEVSVLDPASARVPLAVSHKLRCIVDSVEHAQQFPDYFTAFEAIVNLTGGLDDAHTDMMPAFSVQACAPAYLKHASNARVIHISTQYVYSDAVLNKERSSPAPVCAYGLMHAMAEQAVQDEVILRFGTVWGPGTYTRYDTWGNHLKQIVDASKPVEECYPNHLLCLLHISTAVRAVAWALEDGAGTYNVADKQGFKDELVQEFCGDVPVTFRRFTGGMSQGMDCSRIVKAGFELSEKEFTSAGYILQRE